MGPGRRVLCGLAALALAALAGSAGAATFTVNSSADTSDGVCSAAADGCTLREAIEGSVAAPGRDTIRFAPSVFPPGVLTPIVILTVLPVMADAAGTVIDGAGAGVVIESGVGVGPPGNPLIFASAAGVPLRQPAISNLVVRGFMGNAITICGGEPSTCAEDVFDAVVQNVVATGNGGVGIRLDGRNLTKTRIVASVASENGGGGFLCEAAGGIFGMRIDGLAARDNGGNGIRLFSNADGADNAIANSIAVRSAQFGVSFTGDARLTKTRLTNVHSASNGLAGISVGAPGLFSATIATVSATNNVGAGLSVFGAQQAISLSDVVANGNAGGIMVSGGASLLAGVTITNAKAGGNVGDGILLQSNGDLTGNRITQAFLVGNGGQGLSLVAQAASGNLAAHVQAAGNGTSGLLIDAASGGGNTIEDGRFNVNDGNGVQISSGSTANVVRRNSALANAGADLIDSNATCVNSWEQNVFEESFGPCIE